MNQPVTILVKESMLAMAEASVGTDVFRTLFVEKGGVQVDLLRNGDISCANFVSTILHRFLLIEWPHVTVSGLVRDMEDRGWVSVESPEPGDVIIWESIQQASDEWHTHCGFYMGDEKAISNDYTTGVPVQHHYTNELPGRGVTAIYRHAFSN